MRVAITVSGLTSIPPFGTVYDGYGGIERVVVDLRDRLVRMGHDLKVFPLRPQGALHLLDALRTWAPDVVHGHDPVSSAAVAILARSLPTVFTTHASTWYEKPNGRWWFYRLHAEQLAACYLCDATVVPSEPLRQRLRGLGVKTAVIPFGVDAEYFRAQTDRGEARVALGIGAVIRRKAWDVAAAAVQGTTVRFRVVGPVRDPVYAEELRRLGAELVGEVSNERLKEEIEAAGVVVHPSTAEAFPTSILQAMSMSRPVVVGPALSFVPGVVQASGIDEFRARIQELSADEARRAQWGRRARVEVERAFTRDRMAQEYLRLYSEVGASRRGGAPGAPPERRETVAS